MPEDDVIVAPEGTTTTTEPVTEPQTHWLLSRSEELQNSEILNQFKTEEDALRAFIETKKMVGDRVKVPDDTATPEEIAKFYARLGRPENPDGYEITKPEAIPIDEEAVKRFKAKAFEMGLTKKQTEAIANDYFNNILESHNKILTDYEAGVNQQLEVLKNRWGDNFETNRAAAINAFNQFAPDTLKATVEREGWGNNPDFVELFQRIAVATSEDTLRAPGMQSFTSLDDKIKNIDMELFKMDEGDPARRDKMAARDALYKERYPEKPE